MLLLVNPNARKAFLTNLFPATFYLSCTITKNCGCKILSIVSALLCMQHRVLYPECLFTS